MEERINFNIRSWIVNLILISPITTLVQGLPLFKSINKLFLGMLVIFLAYASFRRLKRKTLLIIYLMIIVWCNSFINLNLDYLNVNELIYIWMWIFLFTYLERDFENFKDEIFYNYKNVRNVIIIWSGLAVLSVFYKGSFSYEWGSAVYFRSFADNSFRFATTCMFIVILIGMLVNITKERKYLLYLLIPIVGVAASGSRTYLFLVLFLLAPLYYKNVPKKVFWITLVPIVLVIGYIILNSNMMDKFKFVSLVGTVNNKSILSTITSGRTEFWKWDMEAFLNTGFFHIIFGKSVTYAREINAGYYSSGIQAHNDFINILLSYGMIGLICYIYVLLEFVKRAVNRYLMIDRKYLFVFLSVYISNAFMNGVVYYLGATLSLPLILIMYSEIGYEEYEYDKIHSF